MSIDRRTLFIGSTIGLYCALGGVATPREPYTGPMGPDFASHADFLTWDAAHREFEERIGHPFARLVMRNNESLPPQSWFFPELTELLTKTTAKAMLILHPSRQWAETTIVYIRLEFEGEPTPWTQMYLGKGPRRDFPESFGSIVIA
jgi:hypothetical protein